MKFVMKNSQDEYFAGFRYAGGGGMQPHWNKEHPVLFDTKAEIRAVAKDLQPGTTFLVEQVKFKVVKLD